MKDSTPYIVLLFGILLIALLIAFPSRKTTERIVRCNIDSVYITPKYEVSPELLIKYRTDCGITFSSNKTHQVGDSINIKTIVIE